MHCGMANSIYHAAQSACFMVSNKISVEAARAASVFTSQANTMKFTHLIEINDPLNPLLAPLSREQLWRGLVLRAEAPGLFMPHLDECTIFERNGEVMLRELRYGSVVIRDQVTLLPQQQVQYRIPAQKDIAASSLDMTIEEPQPGALYVRFTYDAEDSGAEDEAQAMYNDFRRSAYKEADIDTISMIRELAASNRFGPD